LNICGDGGKEETNFIFAKKGKKGI
jgi:hypothetical protein